MEQGASISRHSFLPYIQLHEFEALLFCGPGELADLLGSPKLESKLEAIVGECGEPEAIDDRPDGAPSKRIQQLAPHFQKTLHGSLAAEGIGLERIRDGCPHFGEWLERLEGLSEGASPA